MSVERAMSIAWCEHNVLKVLPCDAIHPLTNCNCAIVCTMCVKFIHFNTFILYFHFHLDNVKLTSPYQLTCQPCMSNSGYSESHAYDSLYVFAMWMCIHVVDISNIWSWKIVEIFSKSALYIHTLEFTEELTSIVITGW